MADPDPGALPVLLLHGQPGSGADFAAVETAMRQLAGPGGAPPRILAPNRPGWDGHRAATDLAGNVRAAVAALDEQSIEAATVAGHSFGGAVAALLAVTHPARVAALALAAPAANVASLEPFDHVLAAPVAGPAVSAALLAVTGLALQARAARDLIAGWLRLDPSYLARAGQEFLQPAAWRAFVTEQRALIDGLPGLEARLPEIGAPTVVLFGTDDRIVPPAAARALAAAIPEAELEPIPGADHFLPQRCAAEVATAIMRASERAERSRVNR